MVANFCWRVWMLKLKELLYLSSYLQRGLNAGQTWPGLIRHMAGREDRSNLSIFCKSLNTFIQNFGIERAIHLMQKKKGSLEYKMFLHLLSFCDYSTQNSRDNFVRFRSILLRLQQLQNKQKSMSFLPRFQAMSTIVISALMLFLIPRIFPFFSFGFRELGQTRLLISAWLVLGIGLVLLFVSLDWPLRRQRQELKLCVFLYLNSLLLSSGLDALTTWRKALGFIRFPRKWARVLERTSQHYDSFDAYLQSCGERLKKPWAEILESFRWSIKNGTDLSVFVRQYADELTDECLWKWEYESRKASLLSLLPLYFICLPACLFLLIGPLLLRLSQ